ncbi:MAG: hypothetical protein LKG11_05765 [Bacilli bacterium]|jgi:hypothetical protein|nr:hypothetical protein [Bacilli bacterium]
MEIVESLLKKACGEMPICHLSAESVLSRIKVRLQSGRKPNRISPKFIILACSSVMIAGVVVGSLYGAGLFKTETPMKAAFEYGLGKEVSNGTDSFTLKDSWLRNETLSLEAKVNLSSNGSVFYASSLTVTVGLNDDERKLLIDFGSFVSDYGMQGWLEDGDDYSFAISESNRFIGTFDFSFPIDESDEFYSKEIILVRTNAFGINEDGTDLTNVCFRLPTNGRRASTIPQPSNSDDWHE